MASTTSLTDSRSNPGRLTVRALATAVGITADAVRFYERRGLLPAPERTPAGYRSYTPAAIERLRFIQGASGSGCACERSGICSPCGTPGSARADRPRCSCAGASPRSMPSSLG
jgi:hypothetical protein